MKQRLAVIMLVTLACSGCTMWRAKRNPGWSAATSADQYERLMWEALQKRDYKEVDRHLSSTFVASRPAGTLDRAAAVQHFRLMHITTFEMSDVQTAPAGNDTVVTYLLVLQGSLADQPLPAEPMRVMSIWQTTPHGWLAIAQSFTPASQVTPAPGQ
jgi:ketosteroid isomerase-like protein